jgi:hypothetical protein
MSVFLVLDGAARSARIIDGQGTICFLTGNIRAFAKPKRAAR